jgi:hypothetical protein
MSAINKIVGIVTVRVLQRFITIPSTINVLAALALIVPLPLSAHHSLNSFFDLTTPIVIEGTLTSVRWANPHVAFKLERIGADGEIEVWDVPSGGPTLLRRVGVTADTFAVGDRVTISGYPSKIRDTEMVGVIVSVPDGRDLPMFASLAARFGHEIRASGDHISADTAAAGEREAAGIFRVWTFGNGPSRSAPEPVFTDAALSGRAAYDPLTDDPALSCIARGMPFAMDNRFPMEFTERGDTIVLRLEMWDNVRTIHMAEDAASQLREASPLGYSVGRWEGDTLVVTTTDIDWLYFDERGTRQSRAIEVEERFTLSEDEARLDYEIVATDPETFREPAVRYGYWVWVPGEEIQTYGCTVEPNG